MNKERCKIFEFPKIDYNNCGRRINKVVIRVKEIQRENGELIFSACGTVYNACETDCVSAGQNLDNLNEFEALHNDKIFQQIYRLWKLYHLNDMHAGTPEQENYVNQYLKETGKQYDYTDVCDALKAAGLYEVEYEGKPYKYGHRWIYYPIPQNDLNKINALMDGTCWIESRD